MKLTTIITVLLLALAFVPATMAAGGDYMDFLSFGFAKRFLCFLNEDCTLNSLTVKNLTIDNGTVNFINKTVININVTGEMIIDGSLEVDNITVKRINAGFYDWTIKAGDSQRYMDFNGSDLNLNESELNQTIDERTATITYNATTIETLAGTPEGDVESIKGIKDGNVYNVTESPGANPLIIVINFTGVDSFSEIVMREIYSAGSGHNIKIGIETCATGEYEEEFQPDITGMDNFAIRVETVVDPFNHLCGGNVSIRLRHDENGNPSHEFSLDFLVIQSGPTTMVSEEVDPLAFHRSGDVVMQGNSNLGGFNLTETSISASDVDRDIPSDCPADNYIYAYGDNLSTVFCRLDKTNSTSDIWRAISNQTWIDSFTIPILPDTQKYSESFPEIFTNQTKWIVENEISLNIKFAIHEGDLVQDAGNITQWDRANASMTVLDNASMCYSTLAGNHDCLGTDCTNYTLYFPLSRFSGMDCFGGSFDGTALYMYFTLNLDNEDFVFISLSKSPNATVLNWADEVLSNFSNHTGIVPTHDYLYDNNGSRTPAGEEIFINLTNNENFFAVFSGHEHRGADGDDGEAMRVDLNDGGKPVYQMVINYQEFPNGGNGFLRLFTITPKTQSYNMRTYSTLIDAFRRRFKSEFPLDNYALSQFYASEGITAGGKICDGDGNCIPDPLAVDNIYIYNTSKLTFNETKLNITTNASIDLRVEINFLTNILNSVYAAIGNVLNITTPFGGSGGNITGTFDNLIIRPCGVGQILEYSAKGWVCGIDSVGSGGGAGLWKIKDNMVSINTTVSEGIFKLNASLGCGNITGAVSNLCTLLPGGGSGGLWTVKGDVLNINATATGGVEIVNATTFTTNFRINITDDNISGVVKLSMKNSSWGIWENETHIIFGYIEGLD